MDKVFVCVANRIHMTHMSNVIRIFVYTHALCIPEILEYAVRIGIVPDKEPHLLQLARDGLMQAVPVDWKVWYDTNIWNMMS